MSGYLAEIASSILLLFSYMIANGTILLLFISMCLHHRAFYKMMKHSIDKLNQKSNDEIRCDEKFLRDLIQFHISSKE